MQLKTSGRRWVSLAAMALTLGMWAQVARSETFTQVWAGVAVKKVEDISTSPGTHTFKVSKIPDLAPLDPTRTFHTRSWYTGPMGTRTLVQAANWNTTAASADIAVMLGSSVLIEIFDSENSTDFSKGSYQWNILGPDFIIESITLTPQSVQPGEEVTAKIVVSNQGTGGGEMDTLAWWTDRTSVPYNSAGHDGISKTAYSRNQMLYSIESLFP